MLFNMIIISIISALSVLVMYRSTTHVIAVNCESIDAGVVICVAPAPLGNVTAAPAQPTPFQIEAKTDGWVAL